MLAAAGVAVIVATMPATGAGDIQVLAATAMRELLDDVIPQFEAQNGFKVTIGFHPGVDLMAKVKEGAPADIVITTPENLLELTNARHLVEGTRVDFARSQVGVAVKAGAARPDISTVAAVKAAFLGAKSIGVSRGPSGAHLLQQLVTLGIADRVKGKIVQPDAGVRVGVLLAEGKAEIGVQQFSELLPVKGITIVGPLPGDMKDAITYGLARSHNAKQSDAASALAKYLRSAAAAPALKKHGFDPL
jgi:molybdate transport system substrate-binding protein